MKKIVVFALFVFICASSLAWAGTVRFSDDFDGGRSPEWMDIYGSWSVSADRYHPESYELATNEAVSVWNNNNLSDLTVDVDIYNTDTFAFLLGTIFDSNGFYGIDSSIAFAVGLDGSDFFQWFLIENGVSVEMISVSMPGIAYSDIHLRVTVSGDTYRAYYYTQGQDNTGWDITPVTTIVLSDYGVTNTGGYAAIYSDTRGSGLSIDNFSLETPDIVPEPATIGLVLFSVSCLVLRKKK